MEDNSKPIPVVIHGLTNNTPSGLRGVANNITSGVYDIPQPKSYTFIPSIPADSSINCDENSDEELLNIAGKSIFDHDKIHGK